MRFFTQLENGKAQIVILQEVRRLPILRLPILKKYMKIFFQAVVEQTPPSLRKAPPTSDALEHAPPAPGAGHVAPEAIPPILSKIPGINPAHLTEADLLLADPATHTHPLGSHSLLAIHPGFLEHSKPY